MTRRCFFTPRWCIPRQPKLKEIAMRLSILQWVLGFCSIWLCASAMSEDAKTPATTPTSPPPANIPTPVIDPGTLAPTPAPAPPSPTAAATPRRPEKPPIISPEIRDRAVTFRFSAPKASVVKLRMEGFKDQIPMSRNWDGVWDAAAKIVSDGWTAEIEIPFSTVRFVPSDEQKIGRAHV